MCSQHKPWQISTKKNQYIFFTRLLKISFIHEDFTEEISSIWIVHFIDVISSLILYFDPAESFEKGDSHLGKSNVMKILKVKVIS